MNKKDNMAILDDLQKSIEGIPYDNVVMSGSKLFIFFKVKDVDVTISVKVHKHALDGKGMPMFKVKVTWNHKRYFDVIVSEEIVTKKEVLAMVRWRCNDQRYTLSGIDYSARSKNLSNQFLEKDRVKTVGAISLRMKSFMEQYNGSKEKK